MFIYKSQEELAKFTASEVDTYAKELRAHEASLIEKQIATATDPLTKANADLKAELQKANASLTDVAEQLATIKEKANSDDPDAPVSLEKQISENIETLKEIAKGVSTKEIVLKAATNRASVAGNQQAYELNDIGQLAHRQMVMYDLFPKINISESNNNGTIRYYDWDQSTIVRAAAMVAEGAAFPESTAKWTTGTITLKKIGDTLPVTEEFFEDEAMFAGELNQFLETNVSLVIDTQLLNGDNTGENLKGLSTSAGTYTAVASGIVDASIYDLIIKVSEAITTTGGSKYQPNFALLHISDINKMRLKKDANNNYVMPPFVSRDGKTVSTVAIIECNALTPNTAIVGDSRYAKIYQKGGIVLTKGLVNAQFIDDAMTLKARKRLALLVRGADAGGFKKVASISGSLVTLAT